MTSSPPSRALRLLAVACAVGAAVLVPWIGVVLALPVLPPTETSMRVAWAGLDAFELVGLALSALLLLRAHALAPLVMSLTAAALAIDAWASVAVSRGSDAVWELVLAVTVELPLAVALLWAAVATQRRLLAPNR